MSTAIVSNAMGYAAAEQREDVGAKAKAGARVRVRQGEHVTHLQASSPARGLAAASAAAAVVAAVAAAAVAAALWYATLNSMRVR
eukprot:scaffold103223_cov39-Phaeocystis_antarctica.AAC.1